MYTVEKSPPLLFNGVAQAKREKEFFLDSSLGEIISLPIKDGESIKKSDAIATYTNRLLQEEVESQKDNFEKLKVSLNNAKLNLRNAENKKRKTKVRINFFYKNQIKKIRTLV